MRGSSVLFGLICASGSAAALTLAVHEATYVPPLEARVVSSTHPGTLITVVAEVHNTTAAPRCAQIMVAARDREGRDLALASAGPGFQVPPRARRREQALLTVGARDAAERLQRVDAYVVAC